MGQQISRRIAGKLDVGLQRARQEMNKQAREEVARKNSIKHDITKTAGFDFQQQKDEITEDDIEKAESHEMSEDLVKFLNDAGPLQRKVDKKYTSSRLRQSLRENVLEERSQEKDSGRLVRKMPIHGEEMDHVVNRTTNFSQDNEEEEKEKKTGLSDVEMYVMLSSEKSTKDFWRGLDDKEGFKEQHSLIKMSQKYLEIPTILRDPKEKEYLGVAANQIQEAELKILSLKHATDIKLVMSQLLERQSGKTTNEERVTN